MNASLTHLRCEYLENPLGIDELRPRLSWRIDSEAQGVRQVAYRIQVSTTSEKLARDESDLWDSGRIESNRTTHIEYSGAPLTSRQTCHWRVTSWLTDADAVVTQAASLPAFWTMGLLADSDWHPTAHWISANPEIIRRDPDAIAATMTEPGTPAVFRRTFQIPVSAAANAAPIKRATLYATARGLFEFTANNQRVDEDLFAPEWTDYDKRIHYRTYDVTAQLTPGANTLEATLGDGWWSGYVGWQETRARYGSLENSLLAQLEIELTDGTRQTIATDSSWLCSTGPIIASDFMMGETYDARREQRLANAASSSAPPPASGFHSSPFTLHPSHWLPVRIVAAPAVPLVAQRSEPVRITQLLAPVSTCEVSPNTTIYDLGQNISGWARLALKNPPAGARYTLRFAERLSPDGAIYTENLRRAKATDTYIARGEAEETYEPHFTFHGFQYIELTVTPSPAGSSGTGILSVDSSIPHSAFRIPHSSATVLGCVVHSATPPAGHFECSHPGVNRLWQNGLWSQRDNFLSVPTDCPQRDERLGWMGDAQVFIRTATCNMNVAAFFTKWMIDVEDAQTPEGIFPDVAPRLREGENFIGLDDLCGGAAWADAGVIIPWTIWRVYGDTRILRRHWSAMTAWLDYLERTNPDHLRTRDLHNNYGDWLCIPTDTSFRSQSPMKNLLATAYWADDAAKMARMAAALDRPDEARRFTAMFENVRTAFQREFIRPDGRMTVEAQTAYLLALAFDLMPAQLRAAAATHLVENIRSLDWHLSTGFVGISHLNPVLSETGHNDIAYRLLLQETYPSWLYPVKHGATTIWERWNGWTHADGFFNPHMNSFNHYSLGSVGEWLFRHVAGIELDPAHPGYQHFILRPHPGPGLTHAKVTYETQHGPIESAWKFAPDSREFTWTIRIPANTTAQIFVPGKSPAAPRELPAGRYTFTTKL